MNTNYTITISATALQKLKAESKQGKSGEQESRTPGIVKTYLIPVIVGEVNQHLYWI